MGKGFKNLSGPVEANIFYDLNLSVDGTDDQSRRELVAMALRLGYSGIAANHTFTGVMADSDRCKFRPLELQTVLSAAPGVAEAAKFLRQVDLISLDLTRRLPFRLKMPIVKAAIERGIYFEICYGRAICDHKARKDLFSNAQILHSAARGRNIIVSSGAQRAFEMRGPNDAANMATLFGLTLESAKVAVSRNCKSVLLHGVMRKAAYRAAIHIDHTLIERTPNPDNLFNVPTDWDPLSLGGASSDFIPMDEPVGTLITKDSPAISKDASVISEVLNIQKEREDVPKESTSNSLAGSGTGLSSFKEPQSIRDGQISKGTASVEHLPSSVGKPSTRDKKKKLDPSVEKLAQKTGKKRKRKR